MFFYITQDRRHEQAECKQRSAILIGHSKLHAMGIFEPTSRVLAASRVSCMQCRIFQLLSVASLAPTCLPQENARHEFRLALTGELRRRLGREGCDIVKYSCTAPKTE